MTESVLLEFLDKVYLPLRDHCVVCLRTRDDRRLEQPTYLRKFLTSINQPFTFTLPNQLVCYVCERLAAAALRFRLATNVAAQAHFVVQDMERTPSKRAYFLHRLHGTESIVKPSATKMKMASKMMDCETQVRELRARTQLRQTEVLVVCTPSTEDSGSSRSTLLDENQDYSTKFSSRPGESCDLYVVPDEAPNCREAGDSDSFDQKAEPNMELESVFICDEDGPIGIKSEESEPQCTDTNTLMIDPSLLRINTNILRIDPEKHKMDKSTRPVKLLNGPLRSEASEELSLLKEKATLERSSATPTNYLLHPIVFNSGMMTVPSLSGNIINGKLVTSKDTNFVINTPQIALQNGENMDIIVDPGKVKNVLKMLSHQDAAKVHVFTTVGPETTNFEAQPNNAANENIDQNSTFFTDHCYGLNNNRSGSISCNTNTMNKNTKSAFETEVSQKRTERIDDLNYVATGVQYCLPGRSRSLAESRPMVESRLLGESCSVGESRTLGESEGGNEAPSAQLRTDRIDWEDKIPMDLISFIDADENSPKRARHALWPTPPLGIYNVTSLSQEPKDDVIDLC